MTNQQIINEIKAGKYNEYLDAVLLMSAKALQENRPFARAFSAEYCYEANKSTPDMDVLDRMDRFMTIYEEYLRNDCIPF